MGCLSSTGSKISAFGSHCSANFQPILDCFIQKFKLEYGDVENIKTDCVNTVTFNLLQIKQSKFFLETPSTFHFCKRALCKVHQKSVNVLKKTVDTDF